MLRSAPDAISASPYRLGSDRVRTPSTVNALPGSRPGRLLATPLFARPATAGFFRALTRIVHEAAAAPMVGAAELSA
jgi:hypothetical protein